MLSIRANLVKPISAGSTVARAAVDDFLAALRSIGFDPDGCPLYVGASTSEVDSRVPASRLIAVLEDAAQALDDPLTGLRVGARAETRGPLFYLLMSVPRVSDGLRLFTRFARVPLDGQTMRIRIREGVVELTIDLADPAIRQCHHAVDYIVGANLSSLRRAIPGFRLLGVALAHDELGEPGVTARVLGCPTRFGSDSNTLRFSDTVLHETPAAANPMIAEQIECFTATLLDRLTTSGATERVAGAIRQLLAAGAPVTAAAVAKALGSSRRTLQRQLEAESMSFRSLYDRVRADVARALLANQGLKVETIAQSIGFADASSFSKAFSRWEGCCPSEYRTRQAVGSSGLPSG
jgi:AraC-like DNA-binding protein